MFVHIVTSLSRVIYFQMTACVEATGGSWSAEHFGRREPIDPLPCIVVFPEGGVNWTIERIYGSFLEVS